MIFLFSLTTSSIIGGNCFWEFLDNYGFNLKSYSISIKEGNVDSFGVFKIEISFENSGIDVSKVGCYLSSFFEPLKNSYKEFRLLISKVDVLLSYSYFFDIYSIFLRCVFALIGWSSLISFLPKVKKGEEGDF